MKEAALKQAVVTAWNSLVERSDIHLARWRQQELEGDALQQYRARLMIAITEEGPLETEVPELTRMFLEEIIVCSPTELLVAFLDGSKIEVKL